MAEVNKGKWGEWGKRVGGGKRRENAKAFKKPNWHNLNMIFCKKIIFLAQP